MDDGEERPLPPSSSSLFRDISNFKTPKRPLKPPNFQSPATAQFFTASKRTPTSSSAFHRRASRPSLSRPRAATARRLKAFELEQCQSARKEFMKKERSLKSLAKSLTVWLNYLFQNPKLCGCDVSTVSGEDAAVRVDKAWRSPKRARGLSWRAEEKEGLIGECKSSMYLALISSLKDVCSFDDLRQRMGAYLSLATCKEIFDVMTVVTKSIDEGRLKMKVHCPIVTDLGMKEKATKTLMCYNPIWLRIGLYIVFGGDSLLDYGEGGSEEEMSFLKMVIEKQFYSHAGLAKAYAYNKKVEGLYRPGYYDTLGNVILKRFLLLVLILDRAKSQSSLPLKHGIDGLDGGSPLLFNLQPKIKCSSQVINEFLSSDVMHGEGNLLSHLVILGYKVIYQQSPIVEVDFKVSNVFIDLQDGVRLCRAIQLLLHEPSILTKLVVPSDTRKKNLANCAVAMHYLKQARFPLHDEEGTMILEDDIVNGDKELTISLLWNMFVHFQVPLLINQTALAEETSKILGLAGSQQIKTCPTPMEMLLYWIQIICERYDLKIDGFSCLLNGKAIWCLLDFYFRRELSCFCSSEGDDGRRSEESIMSTSDYADAVHNFVLSQKLTTLLGNFPEVLEIGDLLEHNGPASDRSVMVLLVFLSSQLVVKRNVDQLNFHKLLGCNCHNLGRKHSHGQTHSSSSEVPINKVSEETQNEGSCLRLVSSEKYTVFSVQSLHMISYSGRVTQLGPLRYNGNSVAWQRCQAYFSEVIWCHGHESGISVVHLQSLLDAAKRFRAVQAWWQDMTQRNYNCAVKPSISALQHDKIKKRAINQQKENAAIVIQSHFRHLKERRNFRRIRQFVCLLQAVIRVWLKVKKGSVFDTLTPTRVQRYPSESLKRQIEFIIDRHKFVKLRRSVLCIQRALRIWNAKRSKAFPSKEVHICESGWKEGFAHNGLVAPAENASLECQDKDEDDVEMLAATKIQFAWRSFLHMSLCTKNIAAIRIQRHYRMMLSRRKFLYQKLAIIMIQSNFRCFRCWKAFRQDKAKIKSAITIQSHIRGWLARKATLSFRNQKEHLLLQDAVVKIQSIFRCLKCSSIFNCQRHAAIEIQRFIRGQITRNRFLQAQAAMISNYSLMMSDCSEVKVIQASVLKLQRWWRVVLLLKLRTQSAIFIQSHARGWFARNKACRERNQIILIQSHWRGYIARRNSKQQLVDLRLRVQQSAKNVDDSKRLINRLLSAVSELLNMKSMSGILHICATLDMATEHSQRCCEELVAAGAINTLLKLIHSVSRSIPDQQVLKHALSTLRNLARFPHLVEVLVSSQGSLETIFWELFRNKEEAYFIAAEALTRICANPKGLEFVLKSPPLLKRLHNLTEELTRKATIEKRNARGPITRDITERRLRAAVELTRLITNGSR